MNRPTGGKKMISIVVPVYCEELVIDEFHKRTSRTLAGLEDRYDYEIIFVNDGSTDGTLEILKTLAKADPHLKIVDLSRNFGHQLAITAGIEFSSGDAVVLIDSDLQDPPEVIGQFLAKWEEGYEVVYGVRTKRPGETFFKLFTAKVFYRLLNKLSTIEIPADTGDFRLMDRKVVDALKAIPEQNRYLRGLVRWIGYRQCGVSYKRDQRYAGDTKYSLTKMFHLAFDGITGFSEKPLHFAFRFGFFVSMSSFVMILFYVIKKILFPASTIHGWTSTIILILFLGGIQLMSTGVVGLYIGRIYREVKRRPLYLVADKFGFDREHNDG